MLICPTNTVGVMGAGLAKVFRDREPGLYPAYRHACARGEHSPQRPFAWTRRDGRTVLCVATKRHWREPSTLDAVTNATVTMFGWLAANRALSVAIPALGCGLGGLSWRTQVGPMFADHLAASAATVYLYAQWPLRSE